MLAAIEKDVLYVFSECKVTVREISAAVFGMFSSVFPDSFVFN